MVDYVIDATGFGSYYQNVGQNGTDDQVTVNIGTGFSGTVTVDSQPTDDEYENTIVNIPAGWELRVINLVEDGSSETPSFKDWSFEVINAIGDSVGTLSFRSNTIMGVPCFVKGTMISTSTGPVPIETLQAGDFVITKDRGPQPIRWIGKTILNGTRLAAQPELRPIRIKADALGNNLPSEDLIVSPQHRVLVRSKIAQNMFGAAEVLVAAKQLLQLEGIDVAHDLTEAHYFHMLFDQHEIVFSNGAEAESLHTAPQALKSVGPTALDEIFSIFPELRKADYTPVPARILPAGRQARKLAERHVKNGKMLVM